MKAKTVGPLLFFPVALLFAAPPAMARYDCVAEEMHGDPASRYEKATATVSEGGGISQKHKINVQQLINLGVLDPKRYSRRFFVINYWGTMDSPWNATNIDFNFPVHVKAPNRPLFAFLILNSGEYVERLVMDANGRDQFGGIARFSADAPAPQITASFGFIRKSLDAPETSFLDALSKATLMTIELKYSDGETLARETFNVSRSTIMQHTLDSALKMHKEYKEKCRFSPEQVNFF